MSELKRAMGEAETLPVVDPSRTAVVADELAEREICSGLLHVRGAVAEIDGLVKVEDFHAPARGEIVRAAFALHRAGEAIDEMTVAAYLTRRRVFDRFGGVAWLESFRAGVPNPKVLPTLARTVADLATARRVVEMAYRIAADGLSSTDAPRDFVERSVDRLARIAEARTSARVVVLEDVVARRRETWKRNRDEGLRPGGMPSGFPDLDRITRGLRLKAVSFAGALTGRGKTIYAMQIAKAVAGIEFNGEIAGVTYVSGEMDAEALHDRAVCALAGVSERDLERVMSKAPDEPGERPLSMTDRAAIWDAVVAAQAELERLPWAMYPHVAGIADIRAALRDSQRQWRERAADPKKAARPMLLVCDYVQMMKVKKADRHDIALGEFVYETKDIADRQNLHVLHLAQMTKSIRDNRGSGAAQAEDMKNASALAESASTVVYIHRPAYDMPKGSDKRSAMWPYTEFHVTKGRGHGLGEVPMIFEGKHYRFREPRGEEVAQMLEAADSGDRRKAYAPGKEPGAQKTWTE